MTKTQYRLVRSINWARYLFYKGKYGKRLAKVIKFKNRIIYACDIGITAQIPMSSTFHHCGLGVVIGNTTVIGENCEIYSNVTIGSKKMAGEKGRNPHIGNNVVICTGASVLGDVSIGDNCIIGAGAVVLKSFPANSLICGVPAEKIRDLDSF